MAQYKKQYDLYKSGSNLVLTVDHRARGAIGPSSDVQSLSSRYSARELREDMGTRIGERDSASVSKKRKRGSDETLTFATMIASQPPPLSQAPPLTVYRPTTREMRLVYDTYLSFLSSLLSQSSSHDILVSLADELLYIVKDDNLSTREQHSEIETMLGQRVDDDKFRQLVNITKKINDWTPITDTHADIVSGGIDDRLGVAVQFNSDDDDDNDDGDGDEDDQFVDTIDDTIDDADDTIANTDANDSQVLHSKDAQPTTDTHVNTDSDDDVIDASTIAHPDKKSQSFDHRAIDAHWLQRQVSSFITDAQSSQSLSTSILSSMSSLTLTDGAVETRLVEMLGFDHFALIKQCVQHRWMIVYAMRLARAEDDSQRNAILEELKHNDRAREARQLLLNDGLSTGVSINDSDSAMKVDSDSDNKPPSLPNTSNQSEAYWLTKPRSVIDLDSLLLTGGGHYMSNTETTLPKGSEMFTTKEYVEVHVPASRSSVSDSASDRLVEVASMPSWAQPAFKGMTTLNRIQSRVYDSAINSADNMLICAPTGAGKTNVAMLTMLQTIGLYRQSESASDNDSGRVKVPVKLDAFKMVYIAPMKSLVAEMVLNFGARLAPYGITVSELSGDQSLSADQLSSTQLIVTTPEKFDVITRKSIERSYINAVRLIIIDEIHLLHDSRGPVLESIIARTIRRIEEEQQHVRLVGLSATLPNHEDVALLLRVNTNSGLFTFDASYRPVPLHSQYVGLTQKKAFKRMQAMNDICYQKVMNVAGKKQILIFVHSRKDTAVTAKSLKDKAAENQLLNKFLDENNVGRQELLSVESKNVSNENLRALLPVGLAIHHAGMTRKDRTLVEELFADGHIAVLVSTATLAWGVNLPASVVIIKGTAIYSPEAGNWTELSHLDVMQMFGRAGRPQYDTSGEGIIITTHSQLQYYLSLLNQQLPIESQLIPSLPDTLNAEIVLGSVTNIKEAVDWLGYSYLYIRMLRKPAIYGIDPESLSSDPYLEQRRLDLVHSALTVLDKHGLVRYDRNNGTFQSLDSGRIASYYYLNHRSIATFNQHLSPHLSEIDLFRIFALSHEFSSMSVREEEKLELASMMDKVPIPIKESIEDVSAKINVLLQSYISQLNLDGFALLADLVYVTQSAQRIVRALFELTLRKGWAPVANKFLTLAQQIEHRCWAAQSPLRQFPSIPLEAVRRIEGKDLTWQTLLDLDSGTLGELVRQPKLGLSLHRAIHAIPNMELSAHIQPITRSLLRVELTLTADFQWNNKIHGTSQGFWLLVEDQDQTKILKMEFFALKKTKMNKENIVTMLVPLFDPLAPQYFLRCVNDRFMAANKLLPMSLKKLILPAKFAAPSEVLGLQPVRVDAIDNPLITQCWLPRGITALNAIQTQCFLSLTGGTSDNVFIAAPNNSGKTLLAELAILTMKHSNPDSQCVYLTPFKEFAVNLINKLKSSFSMFPQWRVVRLTSDSVKDSQSLINGDVIVATPSDWDQYSRKWKTKSSIIHCSLALVLAEHCQMIGNASVGPKLELVLARMRFIQTQLSNKFRIVALSRSVSNGKDIGEWLGCTGKHLYHFPPSATPVPMEIRLIGVDALDYHARQNAIIKPAFKQLEEHHRRDPAVRMIGFAQDVRDVKSIAVLFLSLALARSLSFRHPSSLSPSLDDSSIDNQSLLALLQIGVGWLHSGQSTAEAQLVVDWYRSGAIAVLLMDHQSAFAYHSVVSAQLVLILDTQHYQSSINSYTELPPSTLTQFLAYSTNKSLLFCQANHKEDVKRFLTFATPVESQFHYVIHSAFLSDIVSKRIDTVQSSMDYLTWTFLYRRLTLNPNYYNLTGVTNQHVSDYLSELIESTLDDLSESRMVAIESMSDTDSGVEILNLGLIASYYEVDYLTIEIFNRSLTRKSKWKQIFDSLSAATEFDSVRVREKEEIVIGNLARHSKFAVTTSTASNARNNNDGKGDSESLLDYSDAHVKVNVLLQSHLSRRSLPAAMTSDLHNDILPLTPKLCCAMIDVLSSNGNLLTALTVMELCQSVVQGQWNSESPLLQLPHFTDELIAKSLQYNVRTIPDLLELDDGDRDSLLAGCSEAQLQEIAAAANAFPDLSISYSVSVDTGNDSDNGGDSRSYNKGETVSVTESALVTVAVTLTVPLDDDSDAVSSYTAPIIETRHFPQPRTENWWLVIGDAQRNELIAIKRITLNKPSMTVKLETTVPSLSDNGSASASSAWQLFVISDSWIGADQEYRIPLRHTHMTTDTATGTGTRTGAGTEGGG